PLPIEQGRREHLQAVLPEQTNDEVGVRVDHVEARDEGRDMADPHAVHVGVGDWDDVVVVDPFRVEGPLDHLVPLPGREGIFARVAVLGRADSDDDLLVRFQDSPHHREVSAVEGLEPADEEGASRHSSSSPTKWLMYGHSSVRNLRQWMHRPSSWTDGIAGLTSSQGIGSENSNGSRPSSTGSLRKLSGGLRRGRACTGSSWE